MQEAFSPAPAYWALPRRRQQPSARPGSSRASAASCAGPLQVGDAAYLVGGEQPEHVRQRPGAHPRAPRCCRSPASAASSPARAAAVARRSRVRRCVSSSSPSGGTALGDVIGQRPFRRRPVVGALQDGRARLIGRGRLSIGSQRPRAPASYRPAAPATGASSRLRRSTRSGGRSGASDAARARQRSCGIVLSLPQRCQPRAETGTPGTCRRRLHQLLQHRPRPVRQIQRQQTIGQARFQRFAIRIVRQQIGVLVEQRRPAPAAATNWRRRCAGSRRTHR